MIQISPPFHGKMIDTTYELPADDEIHVWQAQLDDPNCEVSRSLDRFTRVRRRRVRRSGTPCRRACGALEKHWTLILHSPLWVCLSKKMRHSAPWVRQVGHPSLGRLTNAVPALKMTFRIRVGNSTFPYNFSRASRACLDRQKVHLAARQHSSRRS